MLKCRGGFPRPTTIGGRSIKRARASLKKATRYCGSKSEGSENVVLSRLEELLPAFYLGMIFVVGAYPNCERGPLWSYIIGFNSVDSECGIARWVRYTVCYKTTIR